MAMDQKMFAQMMAQQANADIYTGLSRLAGAVGQQDYDYAKQQYMQARLMNSPTNEAQKVVKNPEPSKEEFNPLLLLLED